MRSIMNLGLTALAAICAGCQVVGYAGNPNFDDPFVNDTIGARPPYFPTVLYFPDETMYFFPIYDGQPRSDLNLLAMRCDALADGRLVVTAKVLNLGRDPVAPDWFASGELSALRVAATVTTANGGRERVEAARMTPLPTAVAVDMAMTPTQALAADVVRVDVIADPNRVVPDPLRDNNVLSWQGTIQGEAPQCAVFR